MSDQSLMGLYSLQCQALDYIYLEVPQKVNIEDSLQVELPLMLNYPLKSLDVKIDRFEVKWTGSL